MSGVLMLVNAVSDDPVHDAGGLRRVDFRMTREELAAQVLDLAVVERSLLGRRLRRTFGGYVALAVLGLVEVLRGHATAVLCDNENEALVLALLLKVMRRRIPMVTLVVNPGARKKAAFFRLARVQTHVDLWLAYNTVSADRLTMRYGVPPSRVRLLPYAVDEQFFDPQRVTGLPGGVERRGRPYVLAVGRQDRDFLLLLEVADALSTDVVIAAGSLYSKSPDRLVNRPLPPSVTVVNLGYDELRQAYAGAAVVVLPTVEASFAPGLTALVEAMAMGRPVVYTRAEGSGDYLADRRELLRGVTTLRSTRGLLGAVQQASGSSDVRGPTGLYVPVGDAGALRGALVYLLEHPDVAEEMGRRGRLLVEQVLTLDGYVRTIVDSIDEVLRVHGSGRAGPAEARPRDQPLR